MRTPEQLRNLLHRHAGGPVTFTLTRNRVSLVSVRFDFLGRPRLRLSHAFLNAPETVIGALGQYLQTRSRASWKIVCDFVASREPEPGAVHPVTVQAKGRVFDLAVIRDRINLQYFKGALDCRIGWAKPGRRRRLARTRTLRYGTYNKALNLIRINPVLDDERVPAEFMDYIVFHELLHAAVPSQRGGSRWTHHHTSYRKLESQYPNHAQMQKLATQLVTVLG
jgi:predicted SprT family Zn-dependent metalloprotease